MIAARQIAFGKAAGKGLSAKDYILDGLVSMWDGIENAGWGVHNANATGWKDLVGGAEQTIVDAGGSTHQWSDKSLLITNDPESTEVCHTTGYTTGECESLINTLKGEAKTIEILTVVPSFNINTSGRSYTFNGLIWNNGRYYWVINSTLNCGTFSLDAIFSSTFVINNLEYTYYNNGIYASTATTSFDAEPFASLPDSTLNLLGNKISTQLYTSRNREFYAIRCYNRALTAEEIAHNYEIDKARFGL